MLVDDDKCLSAAKHEATLSGNLDCERKLAPEFSGCDFHQSSANLEIQSDELATVLKALKGGASFVEFHQPGKGFVALSRR